MGPNHTTMTRSHALTNENPLETSQLEMSSLKLDFSLKSSAKSDILLTSQSFISRLTEEQAHVSEQCHVCIIGAAALFFF